MTTTTPKHDNCVVQQTIQSLYMRFRVPKLFRYADEGKWDKIPARSRKCRRGEITFQHAYPPFDTALHRLVRGTGVPCLDDEIMNGVCQLRLGAVEAILEVDTCTARVQDLHGRTPLHLACQSVHETTGAAELLLRAYPRAGGLQDDEGRTPLHYLVNDQPSPVVENLIRAIVSWCPRALEARDIDGYTPLELATKREMSPEIVKCLSAASRAVSIGQEQALKQAHHRAT